MNQSENGFTAAELIITITLIGILITPVVFSSFRFYVDVSSNNRKAALSLDSQAALAKFTDDLRMASGVNPTNTINDPSNPDGWTNGGAANVLIISTPAQDNSGNFIVDSNNNESYKNEVVYFKSDNYLYRRSLPNNSASGNTMIQSCPPAAATPDCPADIILTDKLGSVTYTFYDTNGAQTANVAAVRSVKLGLSVTDAVANRPTTINSTIQVALRNQ